MARLFTPKEGNAIMTLVIKELAGIDASIQEVDSSNFVSAGELALSYPKENVLSALSMAFAKTLVNAKPRKARLSIIQETDESVYASIVREILVYSQMPEAAGDWNTDANTNFAAGYDNGSNSGASVGTMWEQRPPVLEEMSFGGMTVWDEGLTTYEYQLKPAFTSEAEWLKLLNGILVEKRNDIERAKEAFNRMTLLNYMGMLIDAGADMPGSAVNLTYEFNQKYGTSYTTANLLSTYLDDFLAFFVSTVKQTSDWMVDDTLKYHWSPAKSVGGTNYYLIRNTPKADQRLVLYGPLFTDAEANVLPQIFNPEYLSIENAEKVNYWQNANDPMAIDVTPAIPDFAGTNDGLQDEGDEVEVKVLAVLFDKDACKTNFIMEDASTTPVEARKKYYNTWWHNCKNAVNNPTRQGVVFYMADPVPPTPDPGT